MNIEIRTEQVADYFGIAEVHAKAFTYDLSAGEVALVDVHRHRANFDPELSVVAVLEGRVVGHVLLTSHDMLIQGERITGGILAPVAIDPNLQKAGIGTLLIEEVHRRAEKKGLQFCVLLGHPTYYPRFGYLTKMFGTCHIEIDRSEIPDADGTYETRRVTQADVTNLVRLWYEWFSDVDLSIVPGRSVLDWVSPDKQVEAYMVYKDDEWVGYLRHTKGQSGRPSLFLAPDLERATQLLQYLNGISEWTSDTITLPIHPERNALNRFIPFTAKSEIRNWDAAMLKILNADNALVTNYCREVSSGQRTAGRIVWPVEFDVC